MSKNDNTKAVYQSIRLVPFIDILYGLAIGTAFTVFPVDPLRRWQTSLVFLTTIWFAVQDWYEYHLDQNRIQDNKLRDPGAHIHMMAILNTLVIHLMFRYAGLEILRSWLLSYGALCLLGSIYNIRVEFKNNKLFALMAFVRAILWSVFAFLLLPLVNRWMPSFEQITILAVVWLVEIIHIILIARLERPMDMISSW